MVYPVVSLNFIVNPMYGLPDINDLDVGSSDGNPLFHVLIKEMGDDIHYFFLIPVNTTMGGTIY